MKKIILILILFSVLVLAGCTSQDQVTEQGQPIIEQPEQEETIVEEEPQPRPQSQETTKEFTVEGDDLGLYPETLTVSKGDKVKIIFKVRNEKVYYNGLDFRSSVFNTGTILPGNEGTVEFNAENTFTYTSYWPASGVKKATGTIIVN